MERADHGGEAVAVDGEETDELFDTCFDPVLAMSAVLAAGKRPVHASRDVIIPGSDSLIVDRRAGRHHGWASASVRGVNALYLR
jgi:hypothetical protein